MHGVPAGTQDSGLRCQCIGCHAMAEFEKDLSRDWCLAAVEEIAVINSCVVGKLESKSLILLEACTFTIDYPCWLYSFT